MTLRGRTVLVTRPLQQAAALSEAIRAAGGQPWEFPALEIEALAPEAVAQTIRALPLADLSIFISPSAARHGMAAMRAAGRATQLGAIYAVGPGTARALQNEGIAEVHVPPGHDSEALLDMPSLQSVTGRQVFIVRGVGGRALLGEVLQARGAVVHFVECYRRVCPRADSASLIQAWQAGGIDAVTVTSAETLNNLAQLLGPRGQTLLARTPLFVPHAKIGEAASRFGVADVVVTGSGDAGLVEGLVNRLGIRDERQD